MNTTIKLIKGQIDSMEYRLENDKNLSDEIRTKMEFALDKLWDEYEKQMRLAWNEILLGDFTRGVIDESDTNKE